MKMEMTPEEHARLHRRRGRQATVGYQPDVWKSWD